MQKSSNLNNRRHTFFTSSISGDKESNLLILNTPINDFVQNNTFGYIVGSLLLGKKLQSQKTAGFIDLVLRLLVDHGPYVSGAVNTIIASRAGKDMVSALAAGLLTIGPRFGGAINEAASIWFAGVSKKENPHELVERFAQNKQYIAGIGHKKYRIDMPDPRVQLLQQAVIDRKNHSYLDFANTVEKVTTVKKPNLILNVDGVIAALMLDLLAGEEEVSEEGIKQLIQSEFFNALFVLSRSVGFIAHYLDQKRLGEGLFRLSEKDVFLADLQDL